MTVTNQVRVTGTGWLMTCVWTAQYMKTSLIPHTCKVLQRRALHPEAQHLLHRQINRIIPIWHVSAAAAAADRVRTPLYRVAELGFRRRHGGDRGVAWDMRRLSPARLASTGASASAWRPSPHREGKGRPLVAASSVVSVAAVRRPWWGWQREKEGRQARQGRQTHGRLVLHRLALLHNP